VPGPLRPLTFRSLMNERNEFLMTTLPVADLNGAALYPVVFPHVADDNGHLTESILISSGGAARTPVSFCDESGPHRFFPLSILRQSGRISQRISLNSGVGNYIEVSTKISAVALQRPSLYQPGV
jgi:hypothetical protein